MKKQGGWVFVGGKRSSQLPSGAVGIWYMDQYSATPRPCVPNTAAASPTTPKNLLSGPRRLFTNTTLFNVSNATVTDSNASAADGTNDATTVVWASVDGYVQSTIGAELPNATYTLSVDVTTTDASTVDFRMGPNAGMTTKTATPSWQTFSVTFVSSGAPNLFIVRSKDSVTPANLKIINARLHAGSSDLGVDAVVGHLMLGSNAYANLPAYAAAALDTVAGGYGIFQFAAVNASSSFTAIVIGKRTGSPGNVVQPFISKLQSYQQFGPMYSTGATSSPVDGGGPEMYVGSTEMFGGYRGGLWSPNLSMWETVTCRYDGTTANVFLNDSKVVAKASSGKTFSANDFLFNRYSIIGGTSGKQAAHAIVLFNRALSDAEVVQAVAFLKSRAALNSISVNVETRFLCAEGDSITFGVGAGVGSSYCDQFGKNASPAVVGLNAALAGATLAGNAGNSLYGRQTADNAMVPAAKKGRTYIYSMMVGRNELVGYSGGNAQYAADIATFAGLQKAAGWDKVVLCTLLPSTLTNYNAARNAFNAIITAGGWAAGHNVDAICDMGADATMGPDAAASDITWYSDGTHPTPAGQVILETIYRATINAL